MLLPITLAIASMLFFGIVSIIYSLKADKYSREIKEIKKGNSRVDFQAMLTEITRAESKYATDLDHVLASYTAYLHIHLPFAVLSTIYISNSKPQLTFQIKEQVGNNFIREIKDAVLVAYSELSGATPPQYDEKFTGLALNDSLALPATLIHVPFFANGKVIAVCSLSSPEQNAYSRQEMLILYQAADIVSASFTGFAKELMREKSSMLELIEALTDGIILFDTNLQVRIINDAAREYLQCTQENPTINEIFSLSQGTEHFKKNIMEVMANNKKYEESNIQIRERIFNIMIKPVSDPTSLDSEVNGASLLLHDVTMEKSIAQMKEDFTNIIVHELRSPLTSIKASTQLLTSEANLTQEEQQKLITLISKQANKLLDEVARILDAAKLEAGLFTVQKVSSDLGKIIHEKVELINPQAQERFIKLSSDIDPTLPLFSFDPIHIGQVINNLLSNSMKFTSSGGSIQISAKQETGKVIVTVSDTGCGIPKDKHQLLFTKFSQISTPGAHVGTGLGLYITKGIVQAHGGTIMLNSQEGQGTTITFTLPVELNASTSTVPNEATTAINKPLVN